LGFHSDNPPEHLIGIDLEYKTVTSQTPLPVSSDLIAFNSIDGKIYISAEDADNTMPMPMRAFTRMIRRAAIQERSRRL
jgi:hypothetical protein